MPSNRKTGLGTSAFFKPREVVPGEAASSSPEAQQQVHQAQPISPPPLEPLAQEDSPRKMRTTVMLYPETLANMELLKIQGRKRGKRTTYSDILNEAIQLLMERQEVVNRA